MAHGSARPGTRGSRRETEQGMTKTEHQLADLLEAGPEDSLELTDGEIAQKVDLGRKFANWRTVASFSFALIILVVALSKSGVSVSDLKDALRQVNPALYVAAFLLYYVSFPLRTIRWRILMRNANTG